MVEKQKFFLDMFYRIDEPLMMKEYEGMGDKFIHEKDMFKVNCIFLKDLHNILKILTEIRLRNGTFR